MLPVFTVLSYQGSSTCYYPVISKLIDWSNWSYINNNKPIKYVSCLSNYQMPISINNLQIIKNKKVNR